MTKIVDLTYLNELARGNKEFMAEMIGIFLEHANSNLEDLKKYIKAKDWKEAENICHKMKSSYAYFGVKDLQELMNEMENACNKGLIDENRFLVIIAQADDKTALAIKELDQELQQLRN